ncbi:MAG: glycosyltransferase family 4 protein [Candidatus Nitrospinota bacterium M3_3B_026]
MIKIAHVITSLDVGGAELALDDLAGRLDPARFDNIVISLMDIGAVGRRLKRKGAPVHALGMRRGVPGPMAFLRLVRLLRAERPDVVQTWLYHADLAGTLASSLAGGVPVVWNIRCVDMLGGRRLSPLYAVMKILSWLSGRPEAIIVNSEAGRDFHARFGYRADKLTVIHNGIDTEKFRPSPEARQAARERIGVAGETPLIGYAARYDPVKGFDLFLDAFAMTIKKFPRARAVLAGDGTASENGELSGLIARRGLEEKIIRLGSMEDMASLYPAFDLFALASRSEGFSNVTAEAMACGVPCAVTDVGDTALIVGDTGFVAPPGDAAALADVIGRALSLGADERAALGGRARERIAERFSPAVMVRRYEELYERAARPGPR